MGLSARRPSVAASQSPDWLLMWYLRPNTEQQRRGDFLGDIWIRDIDRKDYRFTPRLALASSGKPSSLGNLQFPYAPADRFVDADGECDGG